MLQAVIFDFYYSLGDSTKGIALSVNYALRKLGYAEKSIEAIKKTIGLSLRETFFALTGKNAENESRLFSKCFKEMADRNNYKRRI